MMWLLVDSHNAVMTQVGLVQCDGVSFQYLWRVHFCTLQFEQYVI